jgi:CTP-dependent riboflavin kinase
MRVLRGIVADGYKCASANLAPVIRLIEARTGMIDLVPGTLNVKIPDDYILTAMALVRPEEYPLNRISGANETIKLQRCLIRGHKAIIMRPDTHETIGWGHGTKCLELIGAVRFRDTLGLTNDSVVEVEVEGDDAWWACGI